MRSSCINRGNALDRRCDGGGLASYGENLHIDAPFRNVDTSIQLCIDFADHLELGGGL